MIDDILSAPTTTILRAVPLAMNCDAMVSE